MTAVHTLEWLPPSIRQRATIRVLAAGDTLFRQGSKASAIFEVLEGRLRLTRATIDSHPVVLHTARPGELFAEASLFVGTYRCDAIAAMASRVRAYPKRDLLAAFRSDPAIGERFMAVLAHQIHVLRARLEERNIRSARERLLHHVALTAGDDGRTMRIEGTLIDLAAELGLSHEALYRTLADLEKAGEIVRTRSALVMQKRDSV